jgi:sterol desaturase/sphingolipid hydroxylase (fatty acid hydroxylase superfamily)
VSDSTPASPAGRPREVRPATTPSALEQWLARRLGDDDPRRFGSGWASGTISVFLGLCGLGAVAVLHFPQWLSSAELRAQYPLGTMRALIAAVIGTGFLLGCVSLLLRRRKVLGATGVVLAALAMLAGGSRVQIDGELDTPVYLGLDWFLLNLFVFALVFVPLERLFPQRPGQRVLRSGWTTDTAYFAVSHLGIQLLTFLSLLPAGLVAAQLTGAAWRTAVQSQPLALQVFELMLVGDLAQYWTHRAFHRVRALWPFHAVHHSCRELDWLAGSRLHLVDVVVTRAVVLVPIFAVGFAPAALYVWLVIIGLHATVNHVNLRLPVRWIEQILVTPRFHHWHHAVEPPDRNFAVHFPWIDRLFGTHHLPDAAWPARLGIDGDPVPEGYVAQLAYPLRQASASTR